MHVTITPAQMKALEADYMQRFSIPGALLMEHAAQAVCAAMHRLCPGGRAVFLCGPGNNGGDGYAAARLWNAMGGHAAVMELTSRLSGDAAMNRTLALQQGIAVSPADDALPECDLIVDALFGTGLSRAPEGAAAKLIRLANASGRPIVAVDIPSGLDGETGIAAGDVIRARETVTFHRIKPGLLLRQGPACVGTITVAPILIPAGFGTQDGLRCLEAADLPRLLAPRPADAHKGTFGRVVILAGSQGMAGAAGFCAAASVKAGAGLTHIVCPRAVLPIVQVLAPGATCTPLEEADLPALLSQADAAVVGCGLGQDPALLPALDAFRRAGCPVVWDADALNLLSAHGELLPLPENAVITPHPGEAARLLNTSVSQVTADPLRALRDLQLACGCHVLLKGARSLMSDGVHTAANLHGSPALAKGGSGDVLAGMLGALLARRLPCTALETVQLAAWLHGDAALRAAEICGENCLTPTELISAIHF